MPNETPNPTGNPINWDEVAQQLKAVLRPDQALVVVVVDSADNSFTIQQFGINGSTHGVTVLSEEEETGEEGQTNG